MGIRINEQYFEKSDSSAFIKDIKNIRQSSKQIKGTFFRR